MRVCGIRATIHSITLSLLPAHLSVPLPAVPSPESPGPHPFPVCLSLTAFSLPVPHTSPLHLSLTPLLCLSPRISSAGLSLLVLFAHHTAILYTLSARSSHPLDCSPHTPACLSLPLDYLPVLSKFRDLLLPVLTPLVHTLRPNLACPQLLVPAPQPPC